MRGGLAQYHYIEIEPLVQPLFYNFQLYCAHHARDIYVGSIGTTKRTAQLVQKCTSSAIDGSFSKHNRNINVGRDAVLTAHITEGDVDVSSGIDPFVRHIL